MKPAPTYQKLRGGYYTPQPIADFLAQWAITSPEARVLEPSCGDGNLLQAALKVLVDCGLDKKTATSHIYGVEIDPHEARAAAERLHLPGELFSTIHIHKGDFFSYCRNHLANREVFDAIIGNPPFIRYQNFPEEHRIIAFELMYEAGLHPTRLTNSWVLFIVAATLLLSNHGRIAMVVPAELLQVGYTAELRNFLSATYSHLTLVTFRQLVFEGIQQEVVLLLGEKNGTQQAGIRVVELDNATDLAMYGHKLNDESAFEEKLMDHSQEKWTSYFLDSKELDLLRSLKSHPKVSLSGDVLEVDVGIVTGANKFFLLTDQDMKQRTLSDYTQQIVGRSTYLKGTIFSVDDWHESVEKQASAYLLDAPNVSLEELPKEVRKYVLEGEKQGINKGYKCRIRKNWYIVPSRWIPDAFMLRQVHLCPRLILNKAEATCTDTIHRVRFREGVAPEKVTAAFLWINRKENA